MSDNQYSNQPQQDETMSNQEAESVSPANPSHGAPLPVTMQRALDHPSPSTLTPTVLLALQKQRGNQFVQRLLTDRSPTLRRTPDIQMSRLPAQIQGDLQTATTLLQMAQLLKESADARKAATRRFFSSNATHAESYASLTQQAEQAIIQKLYEDVGGLGGQDRPYVLINAFAMKGRGDLVLARKTAEILQAGIGHLDVVFISNEVDNMRAVAPNYTNLIYSSSSQLPAQYRDPLLYIHVGGASGTKDIYDTLGIQDQSIPMFKLLEYGFASHVSNYEMGASLGLAQNELGVIIDSDIIDRTQQSTPAAQLHALEDKTKLKDIVGTANPSLEQVQQYLATTSMYFGYAHSGWSMSQFFDVILASEIDVGDKPNLDVLLPAISDKTGLLSSEKLKFDFNERYLTNAILQQKQVVTQAELQHQQDQTQENLTIKFQEKNKLLRLERRLDVLQNQRLPLLRALNIGEVEIESPTTILSIKLGQGRRKVRILDVFPFSPADFERLLVASGQLTLATGDQSWSQAVSADKTILYEMGDHKTNLVREWQRVARERLADNPLQQEIYGQFMTLMSDWYEANRVQIKGAEAQGAQAFTDIFNHGATNALHAASKSVNAVIRNQMDGVPRILSAVQNAIHNRPAGAQTRQILEQIKDGQFGRRGSINSHVNLLQQSLRGDDE